MAVTSSFRAQRPSGRFEIKTCPWPYGAWGSMSCAAAGSRFDNEFKDSPGGPLSGPIEFRPAAMAAEG